MFSGRSLISSESTFDDISLKHNDRREKEIETEKDSDEGENRNDPNSCESLLSMSNDRKNAERDKVETSPDSFAQRWPDGLFRISDRIAVHCSDVRCQSDVANTMFVQIDGRQDNRCDAEENEKNSEWNEK